MSKKFDWSYKRIVKVNDFGIRCEATISGFAVLKTNFNKLSSGKNDLDEITKDILISSKPITEEKQNQKIKLEKIERSINSLLKVYYLSESDQGDADKYDDANAELHNITDTDLFFTGKRLIEECDALGETITATGITTEMIETLTTVTNAFGDMITKPKEVQIEHKRKVRERDAKVKELNALIDDRLDPLMATFFAETNVAMYEDYYNSSKREKMPTRKLAVTGMITDKSTNQPLTDVTIIIEEADIEHVYQGTTGQYRIQNLVAGTYTVYVKKTNFVTQKLTLVHNGDTTTVFNIELEPAYVAE